MRRIRLSWVCAISAAVMITDPALLLAQAVGPVLVLQNTPVLFDTVKCQTTKCRSVVFRNAGDTMLSVRSSDVISAPFQGAITPFSLIPGQTRTITLCYNAPPDAGIDSQRVWFRADSRVSMSIALLIDVSGSMGSTPFGTSTRIAAAHNAADSLIGDLLLTPSIQDEAAVYAFSTTTQLLQGFTTNHAALLAAVPSTATGTSTCMYDALMTVLSAVRLRGNPPVIVLLTDGQNTCAGSTTTLQDVIDFARQGPEPVRIFTVDIGQVAVPVLRALADSTDGVYQSATDPGGLTAALRKIATLLSQNLRFSFLMRAETVAPLIAFTPPAVDFDGVLVGETRCIPVAISNPGNAPLDVASVGVPAPFSIQNAPGAPIPPGGSATIRVCFSPAARGYSGADAVAANSSCATPLAVLPVRGVGYFASNEVLGPILRITPSPVEFDTTFCRTTKCIDAVFTNVGDTALTVRSIPAFPPPFSASIPTPFTLQPGASRSFPVCYTPPDAPRRDSATMILRADTRVSLSVGMLFDVSGSMATSISSGDLTPRIIAARQAGMDFVSSLIDTLGVLDEAAICAFANTFSVRADFTTDKPLLNSTIAGLAPGGSTRLYSSMIDAITLVSTRGNRRVVIVLTDGADNLSTNSPADVVAAALAGGVTIFTVGVGEADPTVLASIATQTGGRFFSASTTTDLVAVYRQIASLLSQNTEVAFQVRGRGVTPILTFESSSLFFDSTKVGQVRCVTGAIRNTGDAMLHIAGTSNGNSAFTLGAPVADVAPGGLTAVQVCFSPTRLRIQRDTMLFQHNGCAQGDVPLSLTGIGYDSVTIALTGSYAAKPGSLVRIPVRLLDVLPAAYEVTSYMLAVRYNRTLIAASHPAILPSEQPVLIAGSLSGVFAPPPWTETFDAGEAVLGMSLAGGTLSNPKADSTLVVLNLLALLGNARATAVAVGAVQFADGNPRVGVVQPARFEIDSLCYLDQRLLHPDGGPGATIAENIPNPFSTSTRIVFVIRTEGQARLSVLDAYGRDIAVLHDAWTPPGVRDAVFDARGLPAGVYFARLDCAGAAVLHKLLLVK